MSFKEFSATHSASGKDKADDKSKAAPAVDQSPDQLEKTLAEVAPAEPG